MCTPVFTVASVTVAVARKQLECARTDGRVGDVVYAPARPRYTAITGRESCHL